MQEEEIDRGIKNSEDSDNEKKHDLSNSLQDEDSSKNLIQHTKETLHDKNNRSKKKNKRSNEEKELKTSILFACKVTKEIQGIKDISSPYFDPSVVFLDEEYKSHREECASMKKKAQGFFLQNTTQNENKENTQPSLYFTFLTRVLDKIEELKGAGLGSKRNSTIILANFFRLLIYSSPSDLLPAIYICLNKVGPDYKGYEVGIGESLILKALAETYGKTEQNIKNDLQQIEDLGVVAQNSSCRTRTLLAPTRLTINFVFREFKSISLTQGQNSQQKKKDKIKKMLVNARESEAKYIVRFLQQKLRIGCQSATVYQALAYAFYITRVPEAKELLKSVKSEGVFEEEIEEGKLCEFDKTKVIADIRRTSSLNPVELEDKLSEMQTALKNSLSRLPNIQLILYYLFRGASETTLEELCVCTAGIPVQPMLARPTKGLDDVFERFNEITFTCEYKYDGERAQIHYQHNENVVKVFSRNLENSTDKYPDVAEVFKEAFAGVTGDCIVDSEIVAYDLESNKILSFQTLSTRKRKDVQMKNIKVNVCVFIFDCIVCNGESLIKKTLKERRELLYTILKPIPQKLEFAVHKEMKSIEEVDAFLQESIENGCEGLMIKTLDENASYEASNRSLNWLKVKKDYIEGLSDSLDLVPIAAFYGKGKRSGLFGAFLLAAWNEKEEVFQTACKLGTGFSDEDLQTHYAALNANILLSKKSYYHTSDKIEVDVWFEPCQVWECRAADLSLSPVHTVAFGELECEKGIGLRFPRFIRLREDKNPEQATSSQQMVDMYRAQFGARKSKTLGQENQVESDESYTEEEQI